jgi:hypothetical protein
MQDEDFSRKYSHRTTNSATAPPIEEPLSNSAVARPRPCFGNHSETALVAPGQSQDSPSPRKKRNPRKEKKSPWRAV